jgi:hypothetical protein
MNRFGFIVETIAELTHPRPLSAPQRGEFNSGYFQKIPLSAEGEERVVERS